MDTELLAQLIDRKREVLRQLQLLSQRQCEVVAQGEMGRLLSLLAAKQRLLRGLQAIENDLAPFRAEDPDARRWKSAEERRRVRDAAEQCAAVLRDILSLESRCERELAARRDAAAARLHGTHSAAQARQAYVASDSSLTTQLDVSSET